MTILIHSSKTMHRLDAAYASKQQPLLLPQAKALAQYLRTLTTQQIVAAMKVSESLAKDVQAMLHDWNAIEEQQRRAIDSFAGDIYSGLQIGTWTAADRAFAEKHLRILSGLYGILKPNDGILPYRLEMGYKLPDRQYANLYSYWNDTVANTLPDDGPIVNLAAAEYSKLVLRYLSPERVVTPKFLTVSPKTDQPTFVVVHAKIARGAFARWIIGQRIETTQQLPAFNELGYVYNADLSSASEPVYVCEKFAGLGLSVRLAHKV